MSQTKELDGKLTNSSSEVEDYQKIDRLCASILTVESVLTVFSTGNQCHY